MNQAGSVITSAMALLDREIVVEGETLSLGELVDRRTGHLHWAVRDIVKSDRPHPGEASLARAATRVAMTTPSDLAQLAAWLELREVLLDAGLSATEVLELAIEVLRSDRPGGVVPRRPTVAALTEEVDEAEYSRFEGPLRAPPRKFT